MTDTTDIKALRESAESIMKLLENLAGYEPQDIDMDAVELRFEDENGFDTGCDISIVDTAQQSAGIIRALLDQLEAERHKGDPWFGKVADLEAALKAERQRADELQAEQKQHDAQIEQMEGKIQLLTIGFRLKTKHCKKAEEELAALKGDQVPAAWSVGGLLTFHKNLAESRGNEDNLLIEPLYRHPIITGIDENHYDPELEPGLYVAEIMTKGGAACINGRFTNPQKPVVLRPNLHPCHSYASVAVSSRDEQWYAAIEAAGGIVKEAE